MKTRILNSALALFVASSVCGCHVVQAAAPPSSKSTKLSSKTLSKSPTSALKVSTLKPASAANVKIAANVKTVSNVKTAANLTASARRSYYPYNSYLRRRLAIYRASKARSDKVLAYAKGMVGKQDGNGECWTLAANALVAAGAKPASGYVFGTAVTVENARPGDIIQFNNARFEIRTANSFRWFQMGSPNHTAVIETVNGKTIGILQQNVNGDRRVQRQSLDLNTKVSGSFIIYRNQAK